MLWTRRARSWMACVAALPLLAFASTPRPAAACTCPVGEPLVEVPLIASYPAEGAVLGACHSLLLLFDTGDFWKATWDCVPPIGAPHSFSLRRMLDEGLEEVVPAKLGLIHNAELGFPAAVAAPTSPTMKGRSRWVATLTPDAELPPGEYVLRWKRDLADGPLGSPAGVDEELAFSVEAADCAGPGVDVGLTLTWVSEAPACLKGCHDDADCDDCSCSNRVRAVVELQVDSGPVTPETGGYVLTLSLTEGDVITAKQPFLLLPGHPSVAALTWDFSLGGIDCAVCVQAKVDSKFPFQTAPQGGPCEPIYVLPKPPDPCSPGCTPMPWPACASPPTGEDAGPTDPDGGDSAGGGAPPPPAQDDAEDSGAPPSGATGDAASAPGAKPKKRDSRGSGDGCGATGGAPPLGWVAVLLALYPGRCRRPRRGASRNP